MPSDSNADALAAVSGLDAARAVEDFLAVVFAVSKAGLGPFVYRFAPPEDL